MSTEEKMPDETDAASYVGTAMRGRLDDLALLQKVARRGTAAALSRKEVSALEALGVDWGKVARNPDAGEEAQNRIDEFPLSVETTTVFEVVIGIGGPDDRLIFECSGSVEVSEPFEIDRVLYRYSWTGSAERVLTGEDRETAEELARRVVPELVE